MTKLEKALQDILCVFSTSGDYGHFILRRSGSTVLEYRTFTRPGFGSWGGGVRRCEGCQFKSPSGRCFLFSQQICSQLALHQIFPPLILVFSLQMSKRSKYFLIIVEGGRHLKGLFLKVQQCYGKAAFRTITDPKLRQIQLCDCNIRKMFRNAM